jgi:GT2 family glycosyltransferase
VASGPDLGALGHILPPYPAVDGVTHATAGPFISVIMPASETPSDLLSHSIRLVLGQTFRDFELIVVEGSSTPAATKGVAAEAAGQDDRLRVVEHQTSGGFLAASCAGLALARGEFAAIIDHDDLLDPRTFEVCWAIVRANPECDLIYTDEQWVDGDGAVVGSFVKPDWSPERLRSEDYVNHFAMYRRSLLEELGGFREGFAGSEEYDLVLRVTERARQIVHVREILHPRRARPAPPRRTDNGAEFDAARKAIQQHCDRIGIDAWVEQTDTQGSYRVHRRVEGEPRVSVVLPSRGATGSVRGTERTYVIEAVRSIFTRSSYTNLDGVVVADKAMGDDVADTLIQLGGHQLRLLPYDGPSDRSHPLNLGVASALGEYVLLLSDDIEVISPDWIETMLGLVQQPDVGMVGCAMFLEDGKLQHAGHRYHRGRFHIGYGADGDVADVPALRMERECSGVSAACALLRRSDYVAVGGLSRSLPFNLNDVDLSLKLRGSGKRIVWTPFAQVYRFESETPAHGIGSAAYDRVWRRWGNILDANDPYWPHPDDGRRAR